MLDDVFLMKIIPAISSSAATVPLIIIGIFEVDGRVVLFWIESAPSGNPVVLSESSSFAATLEMSVSGRLWDIMQNKDISCRTPFKDGFPINLVL